MVDLNKLVEDLQAARAVAKLVIQGMTDDGGSSNFDRPVISLPCSIRKVREAIITTGFVVTPSDGFWAGFYNLDRAPGSGHQGYIRTAGAEAVEKVLKERGWTVSVYYKMD